jgi:hypothetical protein
VSKQQLSANEGRKGQKTSTKETEGPSRGPGIPNCINLLQAMELEDSSELNQTAVGERAEDEEMFLLPEEWIYNEQEAKKSDGGEREGEEGKKKGGEGQSARKRGGDWRRATKTTKTKQQEQTRIGS